MLPSAKGFIDRLTSDRGAPDKRWGSRHAFIVV